MSGSPRPDRGGPGGALPRHRVALGDGPWSVWRWVWLRGAGFPAHPIVGLGSDALAAQLAAEHVAEARVDGAHRAAMDACAAAAAADPDAHQAMTNVLGRLRGKRLPARETGSAAVD